MFSEENSSHLQVYFWKAESFEFAEAAATQGVHWYNVSNQREVLGF